ncbi:hypothetical protein QE152_g32395 [Popillia japonica]|uniref:CCHC-type domain-containing protein n=1 Tax=Popillia japonica TaxID=7064 RepID=A0AAW1IZL6_POPJA
MALIGNIEPFQGKAEEFETYLERVEHLFKVNAVTEEMKVSMLVTLAGTNVYLPNIEKSGGPEEALAVELAAKQVKTFSDTAESQKHGNCTKCGRSHPKEKCPAVKWKCYNCSKLGHIKQLCPRKKFATVGAVEEEVAQSVNEPAGHTEVNDDLFSLNNVGNSRLSPHHINLKPKTFAVGEKVFVGKLGPYSEDKWKHGIIIKNVSAVTYLVEVEGKIMHKHANNLRAIRHPERDGHISCRSGGHPERDEEGKVTSELPTYVPPLPVIASNGIDTPLMAHDSNTEVANDVIQIQK